MSPTNISECSFLPIYIKRLAISAEREKRIRQSGARAPASEGCVRPIFRKYLTPAVVIGPWRKAICPTALFEADAFAAVWRKWKGNKGVGLCSTPGA